MKNLLLCIFAFTGSGLVFSQSAPPKWFLSLESSYPASAYIAAVGEGETRSVAETRAAAGVSLFFKTNAEVRNQAILEFNQAIRENALDFSQKTYVKQDAVITSREEFLGIRYADPYYHGVTKLWVSAAYIDRAEAARIYDAKVAANMSTINALLDDAAGEKEALYASALLHRALPVADVTEEWIKTAAVVDPDSALSYRSSLDTIQKLRSLYRKSRGALTFSVVTTGDDFSRRVERKVSELLEGRDYVVTGANPQYRIVVDLTIAKEEYDAGIFMRPSLSLRLERNGKTLFSYSKNYDRAGHKNLDGAYNRAFLAIEKDLETNFLAKFTALLG